MEKVYDDEGYPSYSYFDPSEDEIKFVNEVWRSHKRRLKEIEIESMIRTLDQNKLNEVNQWINKGWEFARSGNNREAIACCDRAIDIMSDSTGAYYLKGIILHGFAKYNEAIVCLDKALKKNTKLSFAYKCRGLCSAALNKHEEAIGFYEQAIILNPKESSFWHAKAMSLAALKQYNEALIFYERATKLNSKNKYMWYNRGLCYEKLKLYQEAKMCFEKAVKIDDKYEKAIKALDDTKELLGKK